MSTLVRNLFDIEIMILRLQERIVNDDSAAWNDLVIMGQQLVALSQMPQTPKYRGHLAVQSVPSPCSTSHMNTTIDE